ncbi:MAG: pentapeptide repeat-containing protein, partial [Chloroflexi bacterium]|nr:pentapeptide repeat-containing protein [Chloroflexota bacterium]
MASEQLNKSGPIQAKGSNLSGSNFKGRDLTKSILVDCDLTFAIFRDAVLSKADLTNSTFNDAIFQDATLIEACLKNTHLIGAYMWRVNL